MVWGGQGGRRVVSSFLREWCGGVVGRGRKILGWSGVVGSGQEM